MGNLNAESAADTGLHTIAPDNRLAGPRVSEPPLLNAPSEAPKGSRWLRWALITSDIVAVALSWLLVALTIEPRNSPGIWSRSRLGFLPAMVIITVAMIFLQPPKRLPETATGSVSLRNSGHFSNPCAIISPWKKRYCFRLLKRVPG